ncbi:MAG TPA: L-histidine N(alpha)-methyltransferase [Bryobacteraceae bacterium]|nr:L-histidine N(alpha)-methyltransferase [Bryobacteraceae bacterium]
MYAQALENQFAQEVRAGLTRAGQKTISCRYLYDDVGSALFEAITRLPEYGLTRADARLLARHAQEIVAGVPGRVVLVELGSGSGAKTRPILKQLGARQQDVVYYPIDVSAAALQRCARELEPLATIVPLEENYLDGLEQVAEQRSPGETLLLLFLGSTIGNFELEAAMAFLGDVRAQLLPGDALLLGTDLVKPAGQMLVAYDDPAGVTAAFNRNLLSRINRELDADFDLSQFEHEARYDEGAQRIEMHLRSCRRQTVTIHKAGIAVEFLPGETIWTEASHKFRPEQIAAIARAACFRLERQWIDCEWPFAENLLRA